jgi:hypothetical protein
VLELRKQTLKVGDRLKLSGGYEDLRWLGGRGFTFGTVTALIPGQNDQPAVVARLDEPLEVAGLRARIVVLELRYVDAEWGPSETVHVELCDFEPESKRWQDRRQGKWAESHAVYEVIS